ncbi:MAG: hypothetical protein WC421_09040, partial [Elusimicrobiales bacterium]
RRKRKGWQRFTDQRKCVKNALRAGQFSLQLMGHFWLQLYTFSLYFTSGAANEKVAFIACGDCFCDIVLKSFPHLALLRRNSQNVNSFENTKKLFFMWSNRREAIKNKIAQQVLKNQIEKTEQTIINPIGT